jgi:hypothetical protein
MRVGLGLSAAVGALALVAAMAFAAPAVAKQKGDTLTVCKQGCKYKKIQKAVDASGKNDTIKIKPGTYKEAVLIEGKKHNGLTIKGTKDNPKKVVLAGRASFNNGIEGANVNGLRLLNFTVKDYAANGVFLYECKDYLMKNLRASFNRSYGLFAFDCKGGRITKSVGVGHGDSAFYIGATPFQDNPKWTSLDNLEAYKNVIGYSGTNSKYVRIHHSDFYNNGVGIVPSTLDSEPYEPNATGIIEKNNIFWNNFNYFLPLSPVETVSNGFGQVGDQTVYFPTGLGILTVGSDGWTIQDNQIFGNYKYGTALISDGFTGNEGDDAVSRNNQVLNNLNGRGGSDTNGVDFFADGSGSGNCFQGNNSSTFDPSPTATNAFLYPTCPAPSPPASGTGTSAADPGQLGDVGAYGLANPPETQQCSWSVHPHPPFEDFEPYEVPGFDPAVCP